MRKKIGIITSRFASMDWLKGNLTSVQSMTLSLPSYIPQKARQEIRREWMYQKNVVEKQKKKEIFILRKPNLPVSVSVWA